MAKLWENLLFGFNFNREADANPPESFAPPKNEDGASVIMSAGLGGSYGYVFDLDGSVRTEADLITRYRQVAEHPEVLAAIDEIVNEAIVVSDEEPTVELNLDELVEERGFPKQMLDVFQEEFKSILRLLEFNVDAYVVFKKWYVDGRLYYHIIIDKERPDLGIVELRFIDPRKIKKVKEVIRKRPENDRTPVLVNRVASEYYVYSERGFGSMVGTQGQQSMPGVVQPNPSPSPSADVGLKIAKDSIAYVTSGLLDPTGTIVQSYLHQALRPLNMLRTMEDSAVIYRLVRAPERRVWYIDVGNLPKHKAEQVIYDMMTRHKNKMIYDPTSGDIRDQRRHMTMLEDIWLSRREGNRGTQVETLPGANTQDVMDEVEYFLKKLYKALNVPLSRLEPEVMYSIGRSSMITRDEINFSKFIDRLRARFCELFLDLLEKQLVLKGYVSPDEWTDIRHLIKFKFARDNYFSELKEQEIMLGRAQTLETIMPYVGRFVSNAWARKNVLRQTDEEMEEMDEEIMGEMQNPLYMVQTDMEGNPIMTPPGMTAPPPIPEDKKKR